MKKSRRMSISTISTALGLCLTAVTIAAAPYPIEQWAMRDVISSVQLSPDGKRLAVLKIPSRDGNPIIEIYDAANLDKKPFFRMNADPMEITSVRFGWLNNRYMTFRARQKVDNRVKFYNHDVYRYKLKLLDVEKKKNDNISGLYPSIKNILPNAPNKVLVEVSVSDATRASSSSMQRRLGIFNPRDYYEYDLVKRTKELVVQGKKSLGDFWFDANGNPRGARGYDKAKREMVSYWRRLGESSWREFHRAPVDDIEFQPFMIVGIDEAKPNHALVMARNGHDTIGLWSYDVEKKAFSEFIFRHAKVDAFRVIRHSNRWAHKDKIVGVRYFEDKMHRVFFADDDGEGALYSQLEQVIPHVYKFYIESRSQDGNSMVIYNEGPRDPGTYYLLKNGKLQTIGSKQPLFEPENLADIEYVVYKARDGLDIPAYVTIPKGEPPFPLIVLPHGGPRGQDYPGFDEWPQLLANHGYLVVQPQFRGSTGFGLKLRKAAFEGSGQQGYKMQDDKDDAALYLVKRGLADPQRIAMFGWSYGGYAAAVAALRKPQIYQCVIAGAAVLDPVMQLNEERWDLDGEVRKRYVAFDETAINPVKEVAKINIPMLVIHGDLDSRVRIKHAKKFLDALEDADKDVQYLELAGTAHFTNTLLYEHNLQFYQTMIDYLANDCGPDGL